MKKSMAANPPLTPSDTEKLPDVVLRDNQNDEEEIMITGPATDQQEIMITGGVGGDSTGTPGKPSDNVVVYHTMFLYWWLGLHSVAGRD